MRLFSFIKQSAILYRFFLWMQGLFCTKNAEFIGVSLSKWKTHRCDQHIGAFPQKGLERREVKKRK
jgi:hypothetical protein